MYLTEKIKDRVVFSQIDNFEIEEIKIIIFAYETLAIKDLVTQC